jgi:hypothetical protein
MGNVPSTNSKTNSSNEKNFENFYQIIDYIASYYILTMDFKSLTDLSNKEYCDKLVILTSDIIKKYFNDMEITYLAQRIKKGEEVNELKKENVMFVNKDQLESLDVKNDVNKSIKKKRVCMGIAKFYIKIAHIFAAIVQTINPVYIYTDSTGNLVKKGLLEKDKIPQGVSKKLYKLNICDNRIRSLNNMTIDEEKKEVNLHPKLCSMNLASDGNVKTLNEEPGIEELLTLYLDDNYDYSNGTFTGMSDLTKKQFEKDLKTFYKAFTGNEQMPPGITKFSDIKLRDYKNKNSCQGANPAFKQNYNLSTNDKLFIKYAENIKDMVQSASNKQSELLSVINDLFIFVDDPYSDKKKIRINPTLNEDKLQKIVEKTRNIIIELYVKCETDYVDTLKIYEAIVESKILETTKRQIENLEKKANNIITETNNTIKNYPQASVSKPVTPLEPVPIQAPIVAPIVVPQPDPLPPAAVLQPLPPQVFAPQLNPLQPAPIPPAQPLPALQAPVVVPQPPPQNVQ